MRVCIGLLTCGRDDLTAQTVRSFVEHNDPADPRLLLVHAAEAGDSDAMLADVRAHGFETISRPKLRLGQMAAMRRVLEAAEHADCEFTIIQENDWIWAKPLPWWALSRTFETLRLFGTMKHRSGPRAPAGTHSLTTGRPLDWQPVAPGLEETMAHYVPLSATRTQTLAPWAKRHPGMKAMCRSGDLMSLRVTENVVWSIGEETTPGFKA
jgi:hypothetical protein